jgi:hypothetical protein
MRTSIRKACLAAVAAFALVAGGSGSAMAAWGGHGGHAGGHFGGRVGGGHYGGYHGGFHGGHGFYGGGFGPAFVGGLALGAFAAAPYYGYDAPYGYDDGPDCYLTRRVFIDRWGHRIVRHIEVCD